jgi:hypothetical protein
MDLRKNKVFKEWIGTDVEHLVLFCLQTSMNVSNLGFVPRTVRIPKEVMSVSVLMVFGL